MEKKYDTPEKREAIANAVFPGEENFYESHAFRVALRDHCAPLEDRVGELERENAELRHWLAEARDIHLRDHPEEATDPSMFMDKLNKLLTRSSL